MKHLKNLGTALSKAEQKKINGSYKALYQCSSAGDCLTIGSNPHDYPNVYCSNNVCVYYT